MNDLLVMKQLLESLQDIGILYRAFSNPGN